MKKYRKLSDLLVANGVISNFTVINRPCCPTNLKSAREGDHRAPRICGRIRYRQLSGHIVSIPVGRPVPGAARARRFGSVWPRAGSDASHSASTAYGRYVGVHYRRPHQRNCERHSQPGEWGTARAKHCRSDPVERANRASIWAPGGHVRYSAV